MTLEEGLLLFISCAKSMATDLIVSSSRKPNRFFITQQAKFITENGDQLLPDLGAEAGSAYRNYFE